MKLRWLLPFAFVLAGLNGLANAATESQCGNGAIPAEQSRMLKDYSVSCEGAASAYTRVPAPFDYQKWNALQVSGLNFNQQKFRLAEPAVEWSASIPLTATESWTWYSDEYSANAEACGTHDEPYTCQVDDPSSPIYQSVAESYCDSWVDDAPAVTTAPSSGYSQPQSNRSDLGYNPGPSSGTRESTRTERAAPERSRPSAALPSEERRGSSPHTSSWGSSSGSSSKPSSKSSSRSKRGALELKQPKLMLASESRMPASHCAHTSTRYIQKIVGYHQMASTCHRAVANVCHWNNPHSVTRACQPTQVKYTVRFNKPEASWAPGKDPSYHDSIPNKYDLLPGEWEQYSVIVNDKASSMITPRIDQPANAWNTYKFSIVPGANMSCGGTGEKSFTINVETVARIKRKSPNALTAPVDMLGRPVKSLYFNEVGGKDGRVGQGRPYKLEMVDSSAQAILSIAAQARKFADGRPMPTVEVKNDTKAMTASEMGFWKDTQLRVRLFQKQWIGRDIRFTQNIYTQSKIVGGADNKITIPLEGADGVRNLYIASGPMDDVLGVLWQKISPEVHLNPGADYEIRISMVQRGLPFYEAGCQSDETYVCENDKAKSRAFSEEVVFKFKADPSVDQRSWLEWFMQKQRDHAL